MCRTQWLSSPRDLDLDLMLPVLHQISKQAAEAWILFVYWHQNIGIKRKLSPEGLMEEIGLEVRGVGWGVVSE